MAKKSRLTNNSDEVVISSLISGDSIFSIPYFQRKYKWKPSTLGKFETDILRLVDGSNDFHFLGAIIVHGRPSNPSDPDVYDVIDGQQRITTIFLYLCAAIKTLCNLGKINKAKALFLKFLVINRDTGSLSNIKIHSCKEDRAQLNHIISDLLSKKFKEALGPFNVILLPTTSNKTSGTLKNNYRATLRFFKDQNIQGGEERIEAIYNALLGSVSVVQIDVFDPTNGPKIFDSLNSRQEPMTIGDLVRNEIFSKIADEKPAIIEKVDEDYWQPFYRRFKQGETNLFDDYFFPFGLIHDSNLKKSEVYTKLSKDWQAINKPDEIIDKLAKYQNSFIDIVCGKNLQGHSKEISELFSNLYRGNSPGSTYPFLMQLSNAIKNKETSKEDAKAILEVIESFLVRRAIVGFEPTGLHAVFKKLWKDCDQNPTPEKVKNRIMEHKTVQWPKNDELEKAILNRPLYGASITRFVILEYDRSLGGDTPLNVPWIEHVLPEKTNKDWDKCFSKDEHEKMHDLLANLIPLSDKMNASLGNKKYSIKKAKYLEDSMFKIARKFAKEHTEWTPKKLQNRGKKIAQWAIKRWKH
jgi:uncharacterized protein with ParB-like and HNH nuclease domain